MTSVEYRNWQGLVGHHVVKIMSSEFGTNNPCMDYRPLNSHYLVHALLGPSLDMPLHDM